MNERKYMTKAGYTMVEVLIATGLSSVVLGAVLSAFIWCGRQSTTATKLAWSQREAMNTQMKLTTFMRNACAVQDYDQQTGQWISLKFPDGEICSLVYSNAVHLQRDGRMYLYRDVTNVLGANATNQLLVARGLTEIMDSNGYTTPVFTWVTNSSSVRVAYRVSEPTQQGTKASNDDAFAVAVRFSAALRNSDG